MARAAGAITERARELWARVGRFGEPYLADKRLGIFLTIVFFWLAFLVYYATNSDQTYFRGFVHAADAFLHGRLDVPNAGELRFLDWALYKGKYYLVEPIMPALVVLPGVAIYGTAMNQTLASVVIGGVNASAVHRLMRGLTEKVSAQVWLTLLFVFGTNYWWAAADGSNVTFAHTVAVLFLFLAIHETLVAKRPFLAGLFLGAAHLSRLPTVLGLPFFIIMFSDQWLPQSGETSLIKRINLIPLVKLGAGLAVFVGLGMVFNLIAFETPLPSAYNYYQPDPGSAYEQLIAQGLFKISYIPNHLPAVFKGLPIFRPEAPYVLPSWGGLAFWVATPPFLYAFFAGVKNKALLRALLVLLAIALVVVLASAGPSDAAPGGVPRGWDIDFRHGLEYYPFALMILLGLSVGLHDKLVLACWSAIIPIGLMHFTYVFSGGIPQFGDRFALDYYPFLFLLVVKAVGYDLRWHHKLLIASAILINLWGVVWIYGFRASGFLGLEWVTW